MVNGGIRENHAIPRPVATCNVFGRRVREEAAVYGAVGDAQVDIRLLIDDAMSPAVPDRRVFDANEVIGAILGDKVELGCNTVTSPGTLLAKGVLSYPNTSLRGYYAPGSIVKLKQGQEVIKT